MKTSKWFPLYFPYCDGKEIYLCVHTSQPTHSEELDFLEGLTVLSSPLLHSRPVPGWLAILVPNDVLSKYNEASYILHVYVIYYTYKYIYTAWGTSRFTLVNTQNTEFIPVRIIIY